MMQPTASGAGRLLTVLLLTGLLAACGGGGGGNDGNGAGGGNNGGGNNQGGGSGGDDDDDGDDGGANPPPGLPILSIGNAAVAEGNTGTTTLSFPLTLSEPASGDVTVDYQTQDASAAAGDDYTAASGTLTIPAGSTAATIDVSVQGDTVDETDEAFSIDLLNPSANVLLGTAAATGTITDDDQPPPGQASAAALNDTGTTGCGTITGNDLPCNDTASGTDLYPGQDAERGRDATANDDRDGAAGFSFVKLDAGGDPLPNQSADYATSPWSCVHDQVTGLVWETKTQDGGLHDTGWTYSWFRSSGEPLGASNAGDCEDGASCDTEKFVDAVNAAGLCGANDWRLATPRELLSIVHFGAGGAPFVDAAYFPHTASLGYWTGTVGPTELEARYVSFDPPRSDLTDPQNPLAVRLVREAD